MLPASLVVEDMVRNSPTLHTDTFLGKEVGQALVMIDGTFTGGNTTGNALTIVLQTHVKKSAVSVVPSFSMLSPVLPQEYSISTSPRSWKRFGSPFVTLDLSFESARACSYLPALTLSKPEETDHPLTPTARSLKRPVLVSSKPARQSLSWVLSLRSIPCSKINSFRWRNITAPFAN